MCNTKDILTYREWIENSIAIVNSSTGTKLISLQNKKLFLSGDDKLKQKLENKDERGALLLEVYQNNFDWIQEQHLNSLINN